MKHKIRRLLAGMLAAALVLGASACGAEKATPSSGGPADTQSAEESARETVGGTVSLTAADGHTETAASIPELDADSVRAFSAAAMRELLSGGEGNAVLSPVNLYLCIAMLAEISGGDTRQQVLDTLHMETLEDLQRNCDSLWEQLDSSGENKALTLANSIWLTDIYSFREETLQELAASFHADSAQGTMGSKEMNDALRGWLDENTGGLLSDYAAEAALEPDTVAALASAVWMKAAWLTPFCDSALTEQDIFHTPTGDVTADFMLAHDEESGRVYRGSGWTAVCLPLDDVGSMWFVLPDEGVALNAVLNGEELYELLSGDWQDWTEYDLTLRIPRFDISSSYDLTESLQRLGITDVFNGGADFSPLTGDSDGFLLTTAEHACRLMIDEDGVTGAAFTELGLNSAALDMDREPYTFCCDRPFLAVVTAGSGIPVFAAAVNDPS